jgi:pyruvate/2-oxoglutarate dehydrogenase complex dihydrolipoamide acyltransferase (E2) component
MVVYRDGEITVRKILNLSLAADRRVLDERYAAGFLNHIKDRLQNPQQMI